MKILAVVCANGLGHYRRTTAVLSALAANHPGIQIHLACAAWQIERSEKRTAHWTYWPGITEPGIEWSESPVLYADGRLRQWETRLTQIDLADYDLVLSDNLVGVLAYRPDAVLMGSFLWAEVFAAAYPEQGIIRDFVDREISLLSKHRPPMLCVGPLATPGVKEHTRPVNCSFMCVEPVLPLDQTAGRSPRKQIAVLGGATLAAAKIHQQVVEWLLSEPDIELLLPPVLIERLHLQSHPRVQRFGFTLAEYRRCCVIIGRPGLGTVHDAISAGVPLICVYEERQAEMAHVGRRLAELGLGTNLFRPATPVALRAAIEESVQPDKRAQFVRIRDSLGTDGVLQAANWLSARLREGSGRAVMIEANRGEFSTRGNGPES